VEEIVDVFPRESGKKSVLRKLRREKKIPAIVYGGDEKNIPVWVEEKKVSKVLSHKGVSIFMLNLGGKKKLRAIVKDVSYDPITDAIQHIDFMALKAKHEIEIEVPIKLVGEAPGVEKGGILDFIIRELEIKTIPSKIPDHLELDISELDIGHFLKVSDIKVPQGITVLTPPDSICVVIKAPKVEEEVKPEVEEAPQEPEVIKKGKEAEEAEEKEQTPKEEKKE